MPRFWEYLFPDLVWGLLPNIDFLVVDFLNVDFYNFRNSHRVVGVLFYGNNTNICTVIDCSKFEKVCGRFNFYCSRRPTVFSCAGEWTLLRLVFKNFVLISVLKYSSRWLLLKVLIVVKFLWLNAVGLTSSLLSLGRYSTGSYYQRHRAIQCNETAF